MRGFTTWAFLALVAVLLQGAAKVSELRDIGMGQSMRERVISAPASITAISTIPAGLVFGPVGRAKDGSLVYKIVLPKDGQGVTINAICAGRATTLRVGNYPLQWAPARPAQVAAKKAAAVCCSGGSQPSKSVYSSARDIRQPFNSLWEVNADYNQDTRGWFGDSADGTMTHANVQVRNTYQIGNGLGLFWEVDAAKTSDLSIDWANSAHKDDGLVGAGLGLKLWPQPNQSFGIGIRYNFIVPQGTAADLPLNPYVEYEGEWNRRLNLKVVGTTDNLKAWGGYAQIDVKLHENIGISAIAMGKKFPNATTEGQFGIGPMWYVGDAKAALYVITPTTNSAPPAFGATLKIPLKLQ